MPIADRGKTILLVDDYVLGRKLATLQLRRAGYHVITASTAEEALDLARRSAPDAIVSDIRMAGMNGFELCEAVRGDANLTRLPVLLVSAAIEEHEQQRARAAGAACAVRTSDYREVLDALQALLSP